MHCSSFAPKFIPLDGPPFLQHPNRMHHRFHYAVESPLDVEQNALVSGGHGVWHEIEYQLAMCSRYLSW
jgi:hypothetical protein